MIIVFLGPPGSGKGTQAKNLCVNNQWLHLSTGDLLRSEIESGSSLGKEIKSVMDSGHFVSDELVVRLVSSNLSKGKEESVVLDGFPRTINQVNLFKKELGRDVDCVIDFAISTEKLIDRLANRFSCSSCGELYNDVFKKLKVDGVCDSCGGKEFTRREDDNVEVISERINVYKNQTEPLKTYFNEKKILHSVQADLDIDTIEGKIQSLVEKICNSQKQ